MNTQTWFIVPDTQIPLHDQNFIDKLIDVAEYVKPDGLLFIGDLTDSTEVGRWVKGRSGEYTGNLQAAFDEAAQIVARFRSAVGEDCEMVLQDSNHDARTREYIEANAPALSTLRTLDLSGLLGLDRSRVRTVSGVHEFLPGVVSVHGHERAYSSVPGKYGLQRVAEYGKSVVYGHTHTPLLASTAIGSNGKTRNLWTMNVGHGMDMSRATYLKDGYATWCQAFGLVTHDGSHAYPELVLSLGGGFQFDGHSW